MTVDQIRNALSFVEENYNIALDAGAYGLAAALKDKCDLLWDELVRTIQAEDPYTTEADIRYFEMQGG